MMTKLFLSLFLFSASAFLASCASLKSGEEKFSNWQATKLAERRAFEIRKEWVRQGPENLNMGFRKINRMSPLLYVDKSHGEMIIQANSIDGIVAYERFSGREVWRLKVTNGVESSAGLVQDRLFFGGNDGQFYSVEANTGKIVWTFPTRIENLSEPLLDDGVVYFLTGNNSLYALDAATGKQNWLYTRQDPNPLRVRGGSKPALHNGTLIVGFSDGYLVGLTAKTGQLKWEKQLNRNKKFKDLDTNPLVEGEYVYALGFDDRLYCLRSASGESVWTSEKGGYGGMVIVGDRLFYATSTSEFLAVDKSTGNKIWSYPLPEGGIATTPTLYRGLIVFGESQGNLVFLDSGTGKPVGSFDPGRGILSPPTVDEKNNHVFFISGEANVYSLEIGFKYPNAIPYLR
jgi:outer membrane protein assembly factor BamB